MKNKSAIIICKPKPALINALVVLAVGGLGTWLYLIFHFNTRANFWLQLIGIWLALFISVLLIVIALKKNFILSADRSGIELQYRFPKHRKQKLLWHALQSWQEIRAGRGGAYRQLRLHFGEQKISLANLEHSHYNDLLTWLQKNAANKRKAATF
ncbi:MAG: hypothetical protein RMJ87_13315 [Cytophagales bacterium]|nr:hypothetical protein [Bernardetiaceae bacterium]MDW8206001.1 hypothetical protein [Cytophagales bacterium]